LAYIGNHWRGQLSLAKSFWINVFLINMGVMLFNKWLTEASPIENPVVTSQIFIIFTFMAVAIVYPWQIIGVWRSANRHAEETKKVFWPSAVKITVVLSLFGTLGALITSWPIYKDLYQVGFGKDEYGDYRVELIEDGKLIHLKGGLGFGISIEVNKLIAKNPNVEGIILDSIGGRVYEGRKLSKIILIHSLDTYTLNGCYSACGTAFISGNKRYLAKGANLAFHQYRQLSESFELYGDMTSEQKKDLMIYQRRDISQDFIDKIFKAKQDDLWYPTVDEMLDAGVVHEVVNPSSLKPIKYGSFNPDDLDEALKEISVYQVIKKYEPKVYTQIIEEMEAQMKKGASLLEVKQQVSGYIELIASRSLPLASDKAVIKYISEVIKVLAILEKKNPILCMKNIYPEIYGPTEVTKYLTSEELIPMMDAMSLVIVDGYESNNAEIDTIEGEQLIAQVVDQLGDDSKYFETQELANKEDYSKACKSFIRFYELILANDEKIAGNGLRYAFSP